MGFLIGGRFRPAGVITEGLASEFSRLRAEGAAQLQQIPSLRGAVGPGMRGRYDRISKTAADITRTAPLFYDPRYSHTTLAIPTDERTLNGLYRFYDDTDPVVGNAIRLHVEFPLSRVGLTDCGDPGIQKHFEEMYQRVKLQDLLFGSGIEYWRIGNVFCFGAWNQSDYMWDQFAILNPDYVQVESTWLNKTPLIKLMPDDALKRVVNSGSPKALFQQLPPQIIQYVRLNQSIPVDPKNIFHLAHNKTYYERLGKSIIKRILKTLMLEDRYTNAQFAIASRHVVPLTVVKIGDPSTGWVPNQGEIDDVREMFSAHEIDPNFTIFYHYGINVEFYGATGKILPLQSEFDRIMKLKFLGMGISEGLLTGMGTTYATAFATLEVARQRYLHFQLMLQSFVEWMFRTVSEQCGFYKSDKKVFGVHYAGKKYGDVQEQMTHFLSAFTTLRDAQDNEDFIRFAATRAQAWETAGLPEKREYVYPKLDLDLMSLTNDAQYRQFLQAFDKMFPGVRKVSDATFYRLARLDPDAEQRQIAREKDQERARKIQDLKDEKEFQEVLDKLGLSGVKPGAGKKAPKTGPPPDVPMPPEGPGGEPAAPIGAPAFEGAPPEEPKGMAELESEVVEGHKEEAKQLAAQNMRLLKEGSA